MNQPDPTSRSFTDLIHDIGKGLVKIPQFQREFVWTRDKSAKLLDSILKGYPIGTFIFWKTREQLRSVREIGGAALPDVPAGDYAEQVLDGQQRLTSLFAAARGAEVKRDGRVERFQDLFVDLDGEPAGEDDLVTTEATAPLATPKADGRFVRFADVLTGNFDLLAALSEQRRVRLQRHQQAMQGYRFSIILLKDAPLDVATEVFTRINVSGQPLSVFEIMVAKTYDAAGPFDLADRFTAMMTRLTDIEYETIPQSAVLQLSAFLHGPECRKQDILRMPPRVFRENWERVQEAIEEACEYFQMGFGVPASRLLPYGSLVVPFAYYFAKKGTKPLGADAEVMQELFWRTALSGRYSRSTESRLSQDIRRINDLLAGRPVLFDDAVPLSGDSIRERGEFNTGRSFIKAILCLLASRGPRSFVDHALVKVDNDWLKQSNSRNYHHFFPVAVLKKAGRQRSEFNHIGNITIVDDYLNKRLIKAKKPSVYMKEFRRNKKLAETMDTHLISLDSDGIGKDDYDLFLRRRCERIAAELRKLFPERSIDRGAAPPIDDRDPEEAAQPHLYERSEE